MTTWNITAYKSVGPLKFGASQDEVIQALGKPLLSDFDPEENKQTLYWFENGLQAVFDGKSGPLCMVSLYANINGIGIDGQAFDWKQSKRHFRELLKADRLAKGVAGITVFFSHGIAVAGLESNADGEKSITAFASGQWREDDPLLKPVRVS